MHTFDPFETFESNVFTNETVRYPSTFHWIVRELSWRDRHVNNLGMIFFQKSFFLHSGQQTDLIRLPRNGPIRFSDNEDIHHISELSQLSFSVIEFVVEAEEVDDSSRILPNTDGITAVVLGLEKTTCFHYYLWYRAPRTVETLFALAFIIIYWLMISDQHLLKLLFQQYSTQCFRSPKM